MSAISATRLYAFVYLANSILYLSPYGLVLAAIMPKIPKDAAMLQPRQLSSSPQNPTSVNTIIDKIGPYHQSTSVKTVTTGVAVTTMVLTMVTYLVMMRHASPLSHGLLLPRRWLEKNLSELISQVLVRNPRQRALSLRSYRGKDEKTRFVLLQLDALDSGRSDTSRDEIRTQCPAGFPPFYELKYKIAPGLAEPHIGKFKTPLKGSTSTENASKGPDIWINVASPVTKSLVQIAIWEFVSLWLVLGMIISTFMYNGFASFNRTGAGSVDVIPRLVLVCLYATANVTHAIYAMHYFYCIMTAIGFQACWTLASKLFVFTERDQHDNWENSPSPMNCRQYSHYNPDNYSESALVLLRYQYALLGEIKVIEAYDSFCRKHEFVVPNLLSREQSRARSARDGCDFALVKNTDRQFWRDNLPSKKFVEKDETMDLMRKREIDSLERTAATSLERILTNAVVITGVCFATGLAPYTSIAIPTSDTAAAQIGSYALLAALGTGFTALLNSMTSLANAADSARMLLRFQEHTFAVPQKTLSGNDIDHITRNLEQRGLGFSDSSIQGTTPITTRTLLRQSRQSFMLPFFGPAFVLIPKKVGKGSNAYASQICLDCQVEGQTYKMITAAGQNTGAISLYSQPDQGSELVELSNNQFRYMHTDVSNDPITRQTDCDMLLGT